MFRYFSFTLISPKNSSEEMALFSLLISKDNCWEIMNEIGKTSSLHFLDLNQSEPLFNRRFAGAIKRCDETERKIKFLEEEARRFGVTMIKPDKIDQFFDTLGIVQRIRQKVI